MPNINTAYHHGLIVRWLDAGAKPIPIANTSCIGVLGTAPDADPEIFPENEPSLILTDTKAAALGNSGTLKRAYQNILDLCQLNGVAFRPAIVVVRVKADTDINTQAALAIGDRTQKTGCYAFLKSEMETAERPGILLAPEIGAAQIDGAYNPITQELHNVGVSLGAITIKEGYGETPEELVADKSLLASKYIYYVGNKARRFDVNAAKNVMMGASPFVAGAFALADKAIGFWDSPSNRTLTSINGFAPFFEYSEAVGCEADYLNQKGVNIFINDGGFRLWGSRNTEEINTAEQFITSTRIQMVLNRSMIKGLRWCVDRGINQETINAVITSLTRFLRNLEGTALYEGSEVYIDPEKNPWDMVMQGQFTFSGRYQEVIPLERAIIDMERDHRLIENFVQRVVASSLAAAA